MDMSQVVLGLFVCFIEADSETQDGADTCPTSHSIFVMGNSVVCLPQNPGSALPKGGTGWGQCLCVGEEYFRQ